jgi:hypothetical protein
MGEVGCLKDGYFQNLQVESSSILYLGDTTMTGALTVNGAISLATTAQMAAGTGITAATGELYKASVYTIGNIIYTKILIDITGLQDSGDPQTIIGNDGAAASSNIGQITAAVNGTIFGGRMTCLEVPTGGHADFDLYSSPTGTGAEAAAIGGLTDTEFILINNGAHTIGKVSPFTDLATAANEPSAGDFLYLVTQGDGSNATYTAGRLLIEMFGYVA